MLILAAGTLGIVASCFYRSPPIRVFRENAFNTVTDEMSSAFQFTNNNKYHFSNLKSLLV